MDRCLNNYGRWFLALAVLLPPLQCCGGEKQREAQPQRSCCQTHPPQRPQTEHPCGNPAAGRCCCLDRAATPVAPAGTVTLDAAPLSILTAQPPLSPAAAPLSRAERRPGDDGGPSLQLLKCVWLC